MKLKDFLEKQAGKVGNAIDAAKLTAELAKVADIDIDDDVANAIDNNLITESEAENRPTIKGTLTARALNGIDSLLNPVLADFLEPDEIESLKGDKMTTKKLVKLIEKVKGLKTQGATPGEAAKTISDLNAEILRIKQESETKETTLKGQFARDRFYDKLTATITGRADVIDTVKEEDGLLAIKAFERKIDSVGGVLDVTTGKIMRKDDTTAELFVANKPASVADLLEQSLKEKNYLKVSNAAPTTIVEIPGKKAEQGEETPAQKNARERAERRAENQ
ncbi:hypothetical protein [Fibrivirga algicola]|uniref:Uncharacterized protein n=1 Tax=Fibrivirga algicola TaxID=2950420 RepID=A0ABX0QAS3_9BACT|nr:hypothetical protein [Fibrivirga algicola]NID09365.1 hypothetical protein [Fibrivirga algicola]